MATYMEDAEVAEAIDNIEKKFAGNGRLDEEGLVYRLRQLSLHTYL